MALKMTGPISHLLDVLLYITLFTLITLSEGDLKVMLINEFSIKTF